MLLCMYSLGVCTYCLVCCLLLSFIVVFVLGLLTWMLLLIYDVVYYCYVVYVLFR